MKKTISLLFIFAFTLIFSGCSSVNTNVANHDNNIQYESFTLITTNDQVMTEKETAAFTLFAQSLKEQLKSFGIQEGPDSYILCKIDHDEGNRALRYLVGFGAGAAKSHMQISIANKDKEETTLLITESNLTMGGFGGDANVTITNAAKDIAQKIKALNIYNIKNKS